MALEDKNSVLARANSYAAALAEAANHCETAARAMISVQAEVSENWEGEAGTTMAQKLDSLRFQINQAYAKFITASNQAKADGWSAYSSWPEEEMD